MIGIGGGNSNLEKDKLRIVTSDKEITVVESCKVGNLGVNMNNNLQFNETARLELGTSCEDQHFEWNLQETVPQILLGLKSGSLLSHQMTEQDILDAHLSTPTFSPVLQVWKTPLNDKLLITGTCGVNKELIEKHNNFPRFNVIHLENETEEKLWNRLKTQGADR